MNWSTSWVKAKLIALLSISGILFVCLIDQVFLVIVSKSVC